MWHTKAHDWHWQFSRVQHHQTRYHSLISLLRIWPEVLRESNKCSSWNMISFYTGSPGLNGLNSPSSKHNTFSEHCRYMQRGSKYGMQVLCLASWRSSKFPELGLLIDSFVFIVTDVFEEWSRGSQRCRDKDRIYRVLGFGKWPKASICYWMYGSSTCIQNYRYEFW